MKVVVEWDSPLLRGLSFLRIRTTGHCAWCGEEFAYERKLHDNGQTYCSDSHMDAARKARTRRRRVVAERRINRNLVGRHGADDVARRAGVPLISLTGPMGQGYACHYCGEPGAGTTRDHVVPTSRGGVSYWWNLVPACNDCNVRKGDMELESAEETRSVGPVVCRCAFCARTRKLHAEA